MGPLRTMGEVWKWGFQDRTSHTPFLGQCPQSTTRNIGCPSIMTPSKMGKTKNLFFSLIKAVGGGTFRVGSFQVQIQLLERGAKLLTTGVQGVGPLASVKGAEPPCSTSLPRELLHFWTQLAQFGAYFLPTLCWKSLDLFPIKMLLFFNYSRSIWKWVIYPAHASPSLSPSYSPFTCHCRYMYFVVPTCFLNRLCYTGAARGSIVSWVKLSKGGGPSAPWSWCFSGAKIVIKALTEYVFLC